MRLSLLQLLDKLEGLGGTTVSINVASMTVRDDSDIRKIAKELNTMITNSKRGRGGAYVF